MSKSTIRLSLTYLALIMTLTIGFSCAIYGVSSRQLGRQVPPDGSVLRLEQPPEFNEFIQRRIAEGRHELLMRLIALNIGTLLAGSVVSYALARRSLQPIEDAMAAQAQFVSDASHELRTPLTAIQASNEVFLRRPKQSLAAAKDLIEQNTSDVVRLKQLSDNLLQLAGAEHVKLVRAPISLQAVVSEALTPVVQQAIDKRITVHDETADSTVLADAASLTRALVILLDNAIKYSPDGSTITVRSKTKGRHAYISVTDQGIGIRASDLPHIFRRFYRADNARTSGGYGLGLPIARQLLQAQHGDISVISTPHAGSSFTIKIALADL